MQVKTAHLLAVLGLGLLLGLPSQSLGKNAPPKPPSALAQRGEAALVAGDLAGAEQALTAAYRQTPSADLLFPLGRLAAAQGQLLTAQDLMRRYLNDPAVTPEPAQAAEAQKVLTQPRPPSGKIRVQGDRGGLVLLDGRVLGKLPLVQPLLAAPGQHTLAIQYPGKLLDIPVQVLVGRMVDIQCTRATGAIFLNQLPALLLLAELPEQPTISPETVEKLLDVIERAAQGEQLTILKPEALLTLDPELKNLPESKAAAELKQCLGQPECLQRLLQKAQLEYALRVHITVSAAPASATAPDPAKDKSETESAQKWEFSTELLHSSVLGAASTQTSPCASCTEQKATAALQDVVSRTLAVGLVRPRGTLTVLSEPAGAEVLWGERVIGRTPLSLPAWIGDYSLQLRQPGHEPVLRNVHIESGQTAEVAATLPVIAPPPPPPTPPLVTPPPVQLRWERGPRPRWRIAVGVTSLLVGVGLTVGGAVQLGTTLSRMCPEFPPVPPECVMSTLMSQVNTGVALTIPGGALLVTGVTMLAWPGPRRQVPVPAASSER